MSTRARAFEWWKHSSDREMASNIWIIGLVIVLSNGVFSIPSPDNLAFNKPVNCTPGDFTIKPKPGQPPALQQPEKNNPAFAADGNRLAGPAFLSGLSPAEAWSVDLGAQYDIIMVVIVNVPQTKYGVDMVSSLDDFKINIATQFDIRYLWRSNYTLCAKRQANPLIESEVKAFQCIQRAIGRYVVIIKSPARYKPFPLAEVEVYDTNHLPNIALMKHTTSRTNAARAPDPGKPNKKSPYYNSPLGIDGLANPSLGYFGCFRSMFKPPDAIQWFRVDLGRLFQVRMIKVILCNQVLKIRKKLFYPYSFHEFSGVEFLVAKTFRENNYESNIFTLCHYERSTPKNKSLTIFCNKKAIGRYVVLSKLRAKHTQFSFAELAAYGHNPEKNYALQKPTKQSNELDGSKKGSERATDGDINDEFVGGSCIETPGTEDHEWWHVDLQTKFRIRNIIIKARNDKCCRNNLKNFDVLLATEFDPENFDSNTFIVCHRQKEVIPAGHIKPLYCQTIPMGRHVVISKKPARGEPLTFCEVEVYGKQYDGNLAYGKPTRQRSTYWKFNSSLAVDGDQEITCSETVPVTPGAGPSWLVVDLEEFYIVDKMVIANKRNCKSYCLKNFGLYLTMHLDYSNISSDSYRLCHRHYAALESGQRFNVKCKEPVRARYVVVIATGDLPLILCEIEVYQITAWENLAVAKPTYQSSDWSPDAGGSKLAVDGWRNTDFNMNSCTMTSGAEEQEWWNVDLLTVYRVRRILIVNREDCCEFRLADFKVLVAETYVLGQLSSSDVTMCYNQEHALGPGEIKDVRCNLVTLGQYVIITKNNPKRSPLTLCEVEVYGSLPRINLAYKRPTMQSGQMTSGMTNSLSSRANDGNSNNDINGGSCSETPGRDQMEWWAVIMDGEYVVTSVVLYNRGDCCGNALQNFRILLAKDFPMEDFESTPYYVCYDQRGALNTGEIREIGCQTLGIAKYVIIDKNPAQVDPLIICEAEVYGRLPRPSDSPWNFAEDKEVWTVPYVDNANLTIDGDWDPNLSHGGGIETRGENFYEWWTISLQWNHIIETLRIVADEYFQNVIIFGSKDNITLSDVEEAYGSVSRGKSRGKRAANVVAGATGSQVSTANAASNSSSISGSKFQECAKLKKKPAFGQILEIFCNPDTNGRYLHILKTRANESKLRLFEVKIFGRINDNVPTTTPIPTTTTPEPTDPPTEPPTPLTVYVYPDINKPFIAAAVAGGCVISSALAMFCLCKRSNDVEKVMDKDGDDKIRSMDD